VFVRGVDSTVDEYDTVSDYRDNGVSPVEGVELPVIR